MKFQTCFAQLMLAGSALSASILSPRDTANSNDLNLPSGGMKGKNGVAFGFLPDDSNSSTTIATINSHTGKKVSTYGRYSQITSSSYNGSQLTAVMDDVVKSQAVFQPAVMPSIPFNQVTPDVARQVASVMKKFTDQGVEVWLRFAHEMNYYAEPSSGTYHGTAPEFVAAWRNIHAAVADNPKVLMFWCPNEAPSSDLQQWFPGANYVDIVGIDVYPHVGSSFSSVYGDFYNAFSVRYDKHFAIGETGAGDGSVSSKEAWLKELVNTDKSSFPNYAAASWFEYNKGGDDFRIVEGQSANTVQDTLSNFT